MGWLGGCILGWFTGVLTLMPIIVAMVRTRCTCGATTPSLLGPVRALCRNAPLCPGYTISFLAGIRGRLWCHRTAPRHNTDSCSPENDKSPGLGDPRSAVPEEEGRKSLPTPRGPCIVAASFSCAIFPIGGRPSFGVHLWASARVSSPSTLHWGSTSLLGTLLFPLPLRPLDLIRSQPPPAPSPAPRPCYALSKIPCRSGIITFTPKSFCCQFWCHHQMPPFFVESSQLDAY